MRCLWKRYPDRVIPTCDVCMKRIPNGGYFMVIDGVVRNACRECGITRLLEIYPI